MCLISSFLFEYNSKFKKKNFDVESANNVYVYVIFHFVTNDLCNVLFL